MSGSGEIARVDWEPAGVTGAPPGAAAALWGELPAGPGEGVGMADDPGLPGAAGDVAEDGPPHPDGSPPAG
ncbi:MAG TPA: hypothetical protein VFX70_13620 [Mycobacteriales bacterium]|nr:hypothetical protein [Mycobacteriales bacterium]